MHIAVSGKGGTDKITIAATLCRLFRRAGQSVLALDADSNPNLAVCLGLSREVAGRLRGVPSSLGERRTDDQGLAYVHLTPPLPEVETQFGIAAADNVTLLIMGTVDHAGVGCRCSAHAVARGIMAHILQANGRTAIADMEAGLEHLGRGTVEHADALLVVVEPYYRTLEAGRRIRDLAVDLKVPRIYTVANKVRTAEDEAAVRTFCERHALVLLGTIPFDEQVRASEERDTGLLDIAPNTPLVTAVASLSASLAAAMN